MPSLSIVIPVFNEEKRLPKTFESLKKAFLIPEVRQVIFVNDGSKDETLNHLTNFQRSFPETVIIVDNHDNRGKGFAVKSGIISTKTDFALICDADMSTPIVEINKFLPHMNTGVDVIIGSRKADGSDIRKGQNVLRQKMGEFYALLAKIVTGLFHIDDFGCGFKVFSKKSIDIIFPKLTIDGWIFDTEALLIAKTNNLKIEQVGITWTNDEDSRVNVIKGIFSSLRDLCLIFWNKLTGKYNEKKF